MEKTKMLPRRRKKTSKVPKVQIKPAMCDYSVSNKKPNQLLKRRSPQKNPERSQKIEYKDNLGWISKEKKHYRIPDIMNPEMPFPRHTIHRNISQGAIILTCSKTKLRIWPENHGIYDFFEGCILMDSPPELKSCQGKIEKMKKTKKKKKKKKNEKKDTQDCIPEVSQENEDEIPWIRPKTRLETLLENGLLNRSVGKRYARGRHKKHTKVAIKRHLRRKKKYRGMYNVLNTGARNHARTLFNEKLREYVAMFSGVKRKLYQLKRNTNIDIYNTEALSGKALSCVTLAGYCGKVSKVTSDDEGCIEFAYRRTILEVLFKPSQVYGTRRSLTVGTFVHFDATFRCHALYSQRVTIVANAVWLGKRPKSLVTDKASAVYSASNGEHNFSRTTKEFADDHKQRWRKEVKYYKNKNQSC